MGRHCLCEKCPNRQVKAKFSWTQGDLLESGKHERRLIYLGPGEHVHLLAVKSQPCASGEEGDCCSEEPGLCSKHQLRRHPDLSPNGSAGEEGSPGPGTRRQSSNLSVLGAPYLKSIVKLEPTLHRQHPSLRLQISGWNDGRSP
uniref:Uncharacterized protein n=1 Tax=Myotis myotis TaxID=51298 RepID=A0A7J7VZ19_MYOMY|nr:hypothetical protein mMyoMyo1_012349 [Myotis myotis]